MFAGCAGPLRYRMQFLGMLISSIHPLNNQPVLSTPRYQLVFAGNVSGPENKTLSVVEPA